MIGDHVSLTMGLLSSVGVSTMSVAAFAAAGGGGRSRAERDGGACPSRLKPRPPSRTEIDAARGHGEVDASAST